MIVDVQSWVTGFNYQAHADSEVGYGSYATT